MVVIRDYSRERDQHDGAPEHFWITRRCPTVAHEGTVESTQAACLWSLNPPYLHPPHFHPLADGLPSTFEWSQLQLLRFPWLHAWVTAYATPAALIAYVYAASRLAAKQTASLSVYKYAVLG